LAVAFWGKGAAKNLGIEDRKYPTEIICNLCHGGTNPSEIRTLMKLANVGAERIFQNDRLHAKVYIFDDMAIVGSSNASTNGLSEEGNKAAGWMEANAVITDSQALDLLRKRFDIGIVGRPITDPDLRVAEKAWKARKRVVIPGASLLDTLVDDPERIGLQDIYFAAVDAPYSKEGERERELVRNEMGRDFDTFEKWPQLPREVPIVCFWTEADGSLYPELWRVTPKANDRGKGKTQICQHITTAYGFSVNLRDRRWKTIWNWVKSTEEWTNRGGGRNRAGGIFLPIREIAKAITDGKIQFGIPAH
ncbi:MAG: phospholipase D family protein, partial [Xanthobacteraceae bacterium]